MYVGYLSLHVFKSTVSLIYFYYLHLYLPLYISIYIYTFLLYVRANPSEALAEKNIYTFLSFSTSIFKKSV